APEIEEISDHELLVSARISAEEGSDRLDLRWTEDEEHPTLGGLVQRELGRLPNAGEVVEIDGANITVIAVEGHRLKRLRVEKLQHPEFSPTNGNGLDHTNHLSNGSSAAK